MSKETKKNETSGPRGFSLSSTSKSREGRMHSPCKAYFSFFCFLNRFTFFFFSFELFVLYQDTADQQCCDSFRWTAEGLSRTYICTHSVSFCTIYGEGNGNPLQCSCLENPRDGGAWWAAVYGVAQSRTRLKRLSSSIPKYRPPNAKNWLIGQDPGAGKYWKQEEKGTTKDEMVGWHHRLDGHEFEQALGVGDGQGSLGCCNPWSRKELDTTEGLNWLTDT